MHLLSLLHAQRDYYFSTLFEQLPPLSLHHLLHTEGTEAICPTTNRGQREMSMVEVRVPNLDCEGCAGKLKKALFKLKGVDDVDVEMDLQKITVRGWAVEEKKVLRAIKRAGKAAEPWPYPGYSYFSSFYKYPSHIISHYYETSRNVVSPGVHSFFHTPALYSVAIAADEAVASIFSDDNPNACSVM